jgi:hypothetical protein
VLVLALAWVLFVPAADWLAHHDVGSAKGPLLQTARDTARGWLLTLGVGLFVGIALMFIARTLALLRRGQVTDRYTKAIEQLGSGELDVRIGGIYALEGVARDSATDHPTVMVVLTAFVREHSREPWPPPDSPRTTWITWRGRFRAGGRPQERSARPDIQAAVTVLGRRDARRDIQPIHLNGADLTAADLRDADLGGADLTDATLRDADLTRADLAGATLRDADLTRADLTEATPRRADLGGADLAEAILRSVDLRGADLHAATLTSATLTRADLTGAYLYGAILADADLRDAALGGVLGLDSADLTGTRWPGGTPVPEGWELGTGSDRLERRSAGVSDSGPRKAN